MQESSLAVAPSSVTARRTIAVVLGAALVAVAAQISIPLPGTPVPMTLQPLAAPYGAPGLARLLGPTGGYLLAYPVAAFAVGKLAGDGRRLGALALAGFVGLVLVHLGGVAQLLILTGSVSLALRVGTVPFVVGDLSKLAIAVLILKPIVSPLRARL